MHTKLLSKFQNFPEILTICWTNGPPESPRQAFVKSLAPTHTKYSAAFAFPSPSFSQADTQKIPR